MNITVTTTKSSTLHNNIDWAVDLSTLPAFTNRFNNFIFNKNTVTFDVNAVSDAIYIIRDSFDHGIKCTIIIDGDVFANAYSALSFLKSL